MDTKLVSDHGYLFYDPFLYDYDKFFLTISGNPTIVNGKMRINAAKVNTSEMVMFGSITMSISIPTAPTAGDSRIWGIYSRAYGNRNAAYFFISGTNFYVRTYNDDSSVFEQRTIPWNSDWTNTSVKWQIRWTIDKIEFYADNIRLMSIGKIFGSSTTQFDITNTSGGTFRYTYDGTGADPSISTDTITAGMTVYVNGENFDSTNNGNFVVMASGTNYFEVTNADGIVESNKTIGTGSIYLEDKVANTDRIPKERLMPMYFSNDNSDNMDLDFIEIRDARKLFNAKAVFYIQTTSSSTTTTSSSTTTSISTSSTTTTTSSSTTTSTTVT